MCGSTIVQPVMPEPMSASPLSRLCRSMTCVQFSLNNHSLVESNDCLYHTCVVQDGGP